ncbi:YbhN family protein [Curtobacterium sp. P97]|uniref:lysylphosphatidylglycerol synthase transmembrane domain-containing protein n=1 Tax=Curtobacterium sp. P97 TaxID=2939562 RepID=UPI002041739C|nr:YbhN family protein [Curtobacterium sp. P97]MCM3520076.1 YbhN family protein [Curtobacterium sp. P97]
MDARQPTGSTADGAPADGGAAPEPTTESTVAATTSAAGPTTRATPPAAASRGRRARVLDVVKWAAAVVAVVLLVVGVARQWDEIVADFARLDALTVTLGIVLTLAALVANMLSWRAMMAATGSRLGLAASSSIFFVGQLGKYIPGGVWSIAAQAELGRAHGLARTGSAVASLASMLVSMVTAALVGILALLVGSADGLVTFWWLGIVVVLGLAALTPPVLGRLIAVAMRLLRRPRQDISLTWAGTTASILWSVVMWAAYGGQATLVLRAFGADSSVLLPVATGAYAVAWLVGFLVVIAPAGLGPREGVLLLLLGSVTDSTGALALAVVSRAFMTLGDVVLAGGGAALAVRHRRRSAAATGTDQAP